MSAFRSILGKMKAYTPPLDNRVKSDDLLLDFNERIEPLPQVILDTLAEDLKRGYSIRYPEFGELQAAIGEYAGVSESEVFVGNGSDQIIDCFLRGLLNPEDKVLLPTPSFAMYEQFSQLSEANIQYYDMLKDDPLAHLSEGLNDSIKCCVVCFPNNPTGTLLDVKALVEIITEHPKTFFLIDEAYFEFSKVSLLMALGGVLDNVIITRTFSKAFGLAGFRIGYALASKSVLDELSKIRGPYDVNQMAIRAALLVLKHRKVVLSYADTVMEESKPLIEEALTGKGIEFLPSESNFLFLPNAQPLLGHFSKDGIRVRKMTKKSIEKSIRISIPAQYGRQKLIKSIARADIAGWKKTGLL